MIILFGAFIVFLWQLDFFYFNGQGANAKIVASVLAPVGVLWRMPRYQHRHWYLASDNKLDDGVDPGNL